MRNGKRNQHSDAFEGIPDGDMMLLAKVIGPDATRKVMLNLPGIRLNIPKSKLFKEWYIRTHFTGSNARQIGFDLGLSERRIEQYVAEMYKKPAERNVPRQGSLF